MLGFNEEKTVKSPDNSLPANELKAYQVTAETYRLAASGLNKIQENGSIPFTDEDKINLGNYHRRAGAMEFEYGNLLFKQAEENEKKENWTDALQGYQNAAKSYRQAAYDINQIQKDGCGSLFDEDKNNLGNCHRSAGGSAFQYGNLLIKQAGKSETEENWKEALQGYQNAAESYRQAASDINQIQKDGCGPLLDKDKNNLGNYHRGAGVSAYKYGDLLFKQAGKSKAEENWKEALQGYQNAAKFFRQAASDINQIQEDGCGPLTDEDKDDIGKCHCIARVSEFEYGNLFFNQAEKSKEEVATVKKKSKKNIVQITLASQSNKRLPLPINPVANKSAEPKETKLSDKKSRRPKKPLPSTSLMPVTESTDSAYTLHNFATLKKTLKELMAELESRIEEIDSYDTDTCKYAKTYNNKEKARAERAIKEIRQKIDEKNEDKTVDDASLVNYEEQLKKFLITAETCLDNIKKSPKSVASGKKDEVIRRTTTPEPANASDEKEVSSSKRSKQGLSRKEKIAAKRALKQQEREAKQKREREAKQEREAEQERVASNHTSNASNVGSDEKETVPSTSNVERSDNESTAERKQAGSSRRSSMASAAIPSASSADYSDNCSRRYLKFAVNHLIKLAVSYQLYEKIQFEQTQAEAQTKLKNKQAKSHDKLDKQIFYYGGLYNILRCFQAIKSHEESMRSARSSSEEFRKDYVEDLRNLIVHQASREDSPCLAEVVATSQELFDKLPDKFRSIRPAYRNESMLSSAQLSDLDNIPGLTKEEHNLLDGFELRIDQLPLYQKLAVLSEEQKSNDISQDEIKKRFKRIFLLVKEISARIKEYASKNSDEKISDERVGELFLFEIDALKMLLTIGGEHSRHYEASKQNEIKIFLERCRKEIRKSVAHRFPDCTNKVLLDVAYQAENALNKLNVAAEQESNHVENVSLPPLRVTLTAASRPFVPVSSTAQAVTGLPQSNALGVRPTAKQSPYASVMSFTMFGVKPTVQQASAALVHPHRRNPKIPLNPLAPVFKPR